MKTLLTIICIFTICIGIMKSQDIPVIDPCITDHGPDNDCHVPWNGPYFMEICEWEFDYVTIDCNKLDDCCFTVEYYDRAVVCNGQLHYYDVQIVLVKTSNECTVCLNEYKDLIYDEVVLRKNQDSAHLFDWGRCYTLNHRTMRGQCYHWEDSTYVTCSEQYCCATWLRICYNQYGYIEPDSLEYLGSTLYPSPDTKRSCSELECPDGIVECGQEDKGCYNMPCDHGEWTQDTVNSIEVNVCPGCEFDLIYQWRETYGCTPTFKDYEILSYSLSDSCDYCYMNDQEIHSYIMGWLLKYGQHELPPVDSCKTNYRLLHTACWMKSDSGYYWKCEGTEECCWSEYEICIDLGDTTITKIDGGYPDSSICELYPTQPCFFVCDLLPDYKISFREEFQNFEFESSSSIRPNPNNGEAELDFTSEERGQMILEIYNSNGIILRKFIIQKKDYHLVYPFKISNIATGVFFYKIMKDNKLLNNGSFTKIK